MHFYVWRENDDAALHDFDNVNLSFHVVYILFSFFFLVGLGAFIYHERYANKPHTLDDRYANSESGGCSTSVDDSIGRISYVECSGLDNPRVRNIIYLFLEYYLSFIQFWRTMNDKVQLDHLSCRKTFEITLFSNRHMYLNSVECSNQYITHSVPKLYAIGNLFWQCVIPLY